MKHILKTIATFFLAAGIFAFIYPLPASAACPTLANSVTGTINIQTTGTYDVWSRIQAPDATNNSYILEVDDTTCGIVVGDFAIPSNVWTWINYRDGNTASKISLPLTAGVHTVRLGLREAGVKLDRLLFSLTSVACSPTGTGDNCLVIPSPTLVPQSSPTPTGVVVTPTSPPTSSGSLSDYYKQWPNSGPLKDPNFFPISVWLQDPRRTRNGKTNGQNYKDIGINNFLGIYGAYDASHEAALPAGVYVMPFGDEGITPLMKNSSKVIGYVLEDEPDMNLRPTGCTLAPALTNVANTVRAGDSTRPTFVNFGKGMALPDFFHGANCPWPGEDRDAYRNQLLTLDFLSPSPNNQPYIDWAKVADINSVDHYATTDSYEPANNKHVWGYGRAVRRLKFFGPTKPAWNFLQVTNINDGFNGLPTTTEVTSFVWYSLVNGATGIEYFAHCFNPLREDCLLEDPTMSNHLKNLNAQIQRLAPVLNSPTVSGGVSVTANGSGLTTMVKEYAGSKYIFAIPTKDGAVSGTFTISGSTTGTVEVVDEARTLPLSGGTFSDSFAQHRHHIYKIVSGVSTVTPTSTVVPPTSTIAPTSIPTLVPTVTPTPVPGSTNLSLNVLLHGIGKGGDNVNPAGTGNTNPLRTQRQLKVELFNSSNQLVAIKDGQVSFNQINGNFTGSVGLDSVVTTGAYLVKIKSDQFLKVQIPGIQTITKAETLQLPQTVLITGDINNDNKVDILDYSSLVDCYSDLAPAKNCADPVKKLSADITDDGNVNQFDYNLFLRELKVVVGE